MCVSGMHAIGVPRGRSIPSRTPDSLAEGPSFPRTATSPRPRCPESWLRRACATGSRPPSPPRRENAPVWSTRAREALPGGPSRLAPSRRLSRRRLRDRLGHPGTGLGRDRQQSDRRRGIRRTGEFEPLPARRGLGRTARAGTASGRVGDADFPYALLSCRRPAVPARSRIGARRERPRRLSGLPQPASRGRSDPDVAVAPGSNPASAGDVWITGIRVNISGLRGACCHGREDLPPCGG